MSHVNRKSYNAVYRKKMDCRANGRKIGNADTICKNEASTPFATGK